LGLKELQDYITQHKHLPEIPSAAEMQQEGMAVGELNTKLLQKVEELTLYVITQNERMDQLSQENEQLKAQQKELLQLKARIEKLEKR
jgi:small-conductance mechanosensitive channel